jgi:hypothetical protein
MGLLDLFRPRWKHSNPSVRAEAIKELSPEAPSDLSRLTQVARHDSDARVRRIALKKINDPDLLGELAQHDPDESLRRDAAEKASDLLLSAALSSEDEQRSLSAVRRLSSQRMLVEVINRAATESVRLFAFEQLLATRDADRHLIEVARRSPDSSLRVQALSRISTPDALRDLLLLDVTKDLALRALARLEQRDLLMEVAQQARSKAVRSAARERLGMGVVAQDPAAAKSASAPPTDPLNLRREQLCQRLEIAAKSSDPADFADAEEHLLKVRSDWQALGGEVPMALRKRFERAVTRFQERRDALWRKQQKAQGREEKPQPVLHLPAPVRKEPPPPAPVAVAEKAPEKAAKEAQEDSEERKRAEAARLRREEERKQRESEQAERLRIESERRAAEEKQRAETQERNLARVEEHCVRLEKLAQAESLRAKIAEQALRQAHEVMVQSNPLPRDRAAEARKRYDAARAALVIKLHDLREHEDWQRWANLPRLEALCQKMDALAQTLADGTARSEVAAQLKALQAEWKTVGPAPKDKSELLWQRFKEKADQIFDKLRAATDEERAKNLQKKEELCQKIEALQAALPKTNEVNDWKAVAEQRKALQTEWKAIGPVPTKEQADALWQRFKTAADQVFAEQKQHYAGLDEERGENLKKKEALVGKVEAVIYSTDWKGTTELIKSYQAEWKAVGPAPRPKQAEQEALWQRFRAACDKFFERRHAAFEKLDEERQAHLKQKEALCEQAEAIARKEDLDQDAGEAEIKRLQGEWKRVGPVPQQQSEALWQRFRAACDQVFNRGQQYEAQPASEEGGKFSNKLPLEGVLRQLQGEPAAAEPAAAEPAPAESAPAAPAQSEISPSSNPDVRAHHSWEFEAASDWEDIGRSLTAVSKDPSGPHKAKS